MESAALLVLSLILGAPAQAAVPAPPKVKMLVPEDMAGDVDAKQVRQLVVTFDRPMSTGGWSFCGGGPQYPKIAEGKRPFWRDKTTCVLEVALEPDHVYSLSLNCPAGQNFRSAEGEALEPHAWTFATLPATLLPAEKQKLQNRKALEALRELLERSYSYRELRGLDWTKLFKEHGPKILAARSPRAWASAAGKMLEPTQDLHLWLRVGDDWTVPAGRRRVDPLHRGPLVRKHLAEVSMVSDGVVMGRTEDGIGYLMVAEWSREEDAASAEAALSKLRGSRAMIVDVRPNAGGDETLARRVAAWFVAGTKVYAKDRLRTGKGDGKGKKADGFGPVLERPITGNTDAEKRFDGPVAVLIGPYVMSSCESFVLMMKQAPHCTTVGARTYGSSGRPLPHELPNGVTIHVPSWQDMLPDGTCFEGKGIAPDVEVKVEPADLETRDPILERALTVLREKLKA